LAQEYPIIRVPYDAPIAKEPTGSRVNFWYDDPQLGRCLYKEPRPETGEDWAEKTAAELCELLHLPHAHYELAEWKGQRATIYAYCGRRSAWLDRYPRNRISRRGVLRVSAAGRVDWEHGSPPRELGHASEGDTKPMRTIDAFHAAARQQPEAAREWLRRLATVTTDQTEAILRRVPADIISLPAIEFARALLEVNQRRLLGLRGSIL